jgi:hypothetical protein
MVTGKFRRITDDSITFKGGSIAMRRNQWLQIFFLPLFFLFNNVNASATDVSLAWDASVSSNVSGYRVYVGTSSRSYNPPIPIGNLTTYTVTGLQNGTYYFTVTAVDTGGNESAYSNEVSQVIGDITAPTITAVTATGITGTGATITWTTNEASNSQVEYGTTTSYGSSTTLNSSMVTSHSQALSGLTAQTTYHYQVKSADASGNLATSSDYTFTTSDATAPTITAVTATGITGTGATITWTTNEASNSQVEYGTTTSYGSSTTLNSSMVTSHSQSLSGLASKTTYHYRVKSADASGNLATSGDYTFTTSDIVAPTITAVTATGITGTGATITWTTNEASNSQVEYGTTASYGSSTTLNSSMVTSHSQAISGLAANTTYHYRVRSADASGNLATSSDNTFTTTDIAAPTITAVTATGITSTGATITWTTNEAGNSQVEYGTTTSYGSSTTLNSSMVTSHSQSLSGLAANTTYHYRVKSADASGNLATSSDYTFTTTDVAAPTITAVTATGITSTGATITWTTNEAGNSQVEYGTTTSYGSSTTLNSSMVTSHSQSLSGLAANTTYHYRVKSADASGNLATSSDYTFITSDVAAPTITSVTATGITSTGATITWTTNEAGNSQVEYGTTTSYGSSTTLNSSMVTSHSQAVSGLAANTTYHYRVKSADASGNLATSSDYTFTTSDVAAPSITAVTATGITSTGATITWTTNEASNSQVEYGTTTSYGSSTTLNSSMVTSHSQALTGLASKTTYHYRVKSADASGNLATSSDYTFITSDVAAPTITAVTATGITSTGATITWTTNEAGNSQVEYGTTTSYGSSTTLNSSMVTSHSQSLSGLAANTTYHYRVKSADASGNLATSSDYTFITSDVAAPTITSVTATGITSTGATIAWTTNEAGNSQVEYGTTTSYGSSTTLNSSMVTSHSQALSGLASKTTYHYRVKSADASGNLATSSDYSFITLDATAPTITAVTATGITGTGATITWTTNEAGNSQVEYGTTASYGSSTTLNSSMVTSHSQALSGLVSKTTYHYRVKSADASGNLATSSDYTFTTLDVIAPAISAVTSSGITGTGATIAWTTDEASNSQVEYGTTTSYGSSTTLNSSMVTLHSQAVSGLASKTTYHYRVKSADAFGNLAISADYTFTTVDINAPVITLVTATGITGNGATIAWTTNEASNSQVEYGTTTSYGSSTTLNSSMVTAHSQALSGLASQTTYHFRVKSTDATGNSATSSDYTFITLDVTAPTITAVTATGISGNSATIAWTTNEAGNSQVEYGTTTSYGSSTTINSSMVTSHSQALSGLAGSTTYHFRVKSADASGNLTTSSDYTYTTPANEAPTITAVTASGITGNGATIAWTTNVASNSQVEYGTTTSYGSSSSLNSSMVTSHSQTLSGLASKTTYHFRVKSADASGNLATSSDFTFTTLDITSPNITAVTASGITRNGATIAWSTDEASNSQVEYGTTTSYGSSSSLNSSMVMTHSMSLSALSAGTTYHYRVISSDASGNQGVSGDYSFTTSTSDETPLTISNVSSSGITASSAVITWTTSVASDSQVDYGTTTNYNSGTQSNSSMVTAHSISLNHLSAGTTYYYRVKSSNGINPVTLSGYQFTTLQSSSVVTISSISISNITDKSATISWVTDKPADSEVGYWIVGSAVQTSALRNFATQHTLVLNGLQKLTQYYFHIKATDEDGNQGVSFDADFTTTDSVISDVVMPRFSAGLDLLGQNSMGGLGFTNLDAQSSNFTFTAIDDSGYLTSAADLSNPVSAELNSRAQLPIIDSQLFGTGLSSSTSNGYIKIQSGTARALGFFVIFDRELNLMDGANFEDAKLTDFLFPEVREDGYNIFSLINDNSQAATVTFDLVGEDGAVRSIQSRVIPKMGSLTGDLFNDIFAGTQPDPRDYVRVKSDQGIQSFELMRQKSGDVAALIGQDISAGSAVLYSPQYAVGDYIRTTLSVINLDSTPGTVTFRFLDENGYQLGITRTLPIAAKGKINIDDQAFFLMPDPHALVAGYVEIRSSGLRLAGNTVFGDINQRSSLTSLALVSSLQKSQLFSQIASNDFYYTGLAFLNPNATDAQIGIQVYERDGSLIGSNNITVKAGQRLSRTITQYVPEMIGRNQTNGYVIVTSDQPIGSYALFGTTNLSLLSAIPPLVIQ